MAIVLFASCEKEKKQLFDREAKIVIRGTQSEKKQNGQYAMRAGLTDLEIVQQAANIKWMTQYTELRDMETPTSITRGFSDGMMKDYDKPALLMWGWDIIGEDYDFNTGQFYNYVSKTFLYGYDVFITDWSNDTIAYVPNSVIEAARQPIETAFANGNYNEVYRIFNEAFTFLPIEATPE